MSRMSDFAIWVEDMLVSYGFDPDDTTIMNAVYSKQSALLNLYMVNQDRSDQFANIMRGTSVH